MRADSMSQGSVSWRVCLYLARYPDAAIDTRQIAERWNYSALNEVCVGLGNAVHAGYLLREQGRGRGKCNVYRAGPRILGIEP